MKTLWSTTIPPSLAFVHIPVRLSSFIPSPFLPFKPNSLPLALPFPLLLQASSLPPTLLPPLPRPSLRLRLVERSRGFLRRRSLPRSRWAVPRSSDWDGRRQRRRRWKEVDGSCFGVCFCLHFLERRVFVSLPLTERAFLLDTTTERTGALKELSLEGFRSGELSLSLA